MDSRQAAMLATGVARRGAAIKLAVPAGILFFVMLVSLGIVGAIAGNSSAFASSCGPAGLPNAQYEHDENGGGSSKDSTNGLHAQQLTNAKIIDQEAVKAALPGRATLMALIIALQESTLINLDHGDRDSVGLFQQRPSTGWGTKQQIMDPHYSARMFFLGDKDGDPPGLVSVKGWESMDIAQIVKKVQRPDARYVSLYAGQESEARRIAKEAGIDLDRAGRATGNQPTTNPTGSENPSGAPTGPAANQPGCNKDGGQDQDQTPAEPGKAFHDSASGWPAEVKNPRSTADAMAWARREADSGSKGWYRKCLAFVAEAYGWNFSGTTYAIDHFYEAPMSMRHHDRNPAPGALMYWRTSSRAGHVAIYLGNGQIASNDIREPGRISIVPATDIESKWGSVYEGWAPPYFPKGG
ncbi:peptidase M23 [Streptomyces sp. NPDC006632]|uniref:peptidase M23 n=1 Tax=Streptomyces sp. NPDC006632 TaxID=3157182 RepID=UPI0033AF3474